MLTATISPLAVVLLAFIQATDAEPTENENQFSVASRVFGKRYLSNVSDDDVRNSPAWTEEANSPPVSPRKALKLAEKMRDSVVKLPDGWRWERMSLTLLFDEDHCVWHISYLPVPPDENLSFQDITLVVLMNGIVVKPVATDYKSGDQPDELPPKKPRD